MALWEDAGALVNTEAIVGETQKAWQWATQVSRTFHRPTRCIGCSFDDLRLHDKYILYSSWMTLAPVPGLREGSRRAAHDSPRDRFPRTAPWCFVFSDC